ncbi:MULTISPECIES: hypothetical protein [Citrobacter]|jgi:hypothetical protein|uniref:hypothetical protein n=1 Tax=Citrobacter TaxID=544 RepID=UPI000D7BFB4D|nr:MULTISPECIES: hypothetical protein [Citrobacter]DAI88509.1 MAG TPA: MarR family transcriptional regulator, transcription factor, TRANSCRIPTION REGULATOR.05A [Caudoviricetes sp.]AWS96436.1 hypothetical protein AN232_15080 [Citrobacter sp. CRE-46]MBJ8383883.1 hypothetical protein [Citrobacter cronae]MBX8971252.1 hypothetical protein [Citrobacter werkmanii]MBX9017123.1 hypothetical protein [Citrobacter werkmanii]
MKLTSVHIEILRRASALGPHEVIQSLNLPHIPAEAVNFAISDLAELGLVNAVQSTSERDDSWIVNRITSKGHRYLNELEA